MGRTALEVADIFRAHGPAWRQTQQGHLSLGQLKVMSAIEQCRSAALGGHVLRCDTCAQVQIAYNSCRNRHCPKCQARAARRWLEARQADLLPVDYYHLVFTLPAPISAIAYTNKTVIYDLLFAVAAETLRTIAADPKHLGAQVGATLVLHTWGSALTHHPHVHGIVPGGGLIHRLVNAGSMSTSGGPRGTCSRSIHRSTGSDPRSPPGSDRDTDLTSRGSVSSSGMVRGPCSRRPADATCFEAASTRAWLISWISSIPHRHR